MTVHLERIPAAHAPFPLGRHVEHDDRSRAFAAPALAAPLRDAAHRERVPVYDQGAPLRYRGVDYPNGLGSCTGNAAAGVLSTAPFTHRFHEPTAVRIYAAATEVDPFDGTFPPEDTGSSGLAVAKVALRNGWIGRYEHAFSLDAALAALVDVPVLTGVDWFDSFDRPVGSDAEVAITPNAGVRGGHEFAVVAIDVERRRVRCRQSWGVDWGDRGHFTMSWDTWGALLARRGDVTVFRPAA